MRVALGSDHGGFELKQEIIKYLEEKNIEYKDYGCYSTESTDYPIYAKKVAHGILEGECELESLYAEQVLVFLSLQTKLREFVQQYVQTALLLKQPDFTMTQISLRLEAV